MENWLSVSVFGYPVAEEQLKILSLFGISGNIWLWILRLLSFGILLVGLKIWFGELRGMVCRAVAMFSVVFIFISPLFLILWMVYPLIALKIVIFILVLGLGLKNKYYFLILPIILIIFNWQVLNNKAAIFYKLNLKDAQAEVTKRISSEDSLVESISTPLWWRRIAYNKYFFSYKQIVAETLPFFDFESIFFQEINPLHQKSIVIFFWPETYLFVLGLYFLVKSKNKKINSFLIILIGLSWIDFVFSEGAIFKRLVLVVFPISIILSLGFYNLYLLAVDRKKWLARISLGMISLFIVSGSINSIYDLNIRRDLWLDNRPLAFQFWFEQLNKLDLNNYELVQISSLVGNSKSYCYFYLGKKCNDNKFVFDSFDLTVPGKSPKSIYAGFGGEFVGSNFKNDVSSSWPHQAREMGINIISTKSLTDTIANKYGNDLGVGVVQ